MIGSISENRQQKRTRCNNRTTWELYTIRNQPKSGLSPLIIDPRIPNTFIFNFEPMDVVKVEESNVYVENLPYVNYLSTF